MTRRLFGHEGSLAKLHGWWAGDGALLTLHGPGGVGKTTLATRFLEELGQGQLIDLSACRRSAAVEQALARALGTAEPLVAALESRPGVCLVLDNLEQVASDVASLLRPWSGQGARLICTSRLPLGIVQERCLRLEPLDTAGEGAAVQMFRDRVAARTGTDPASQDPKAVAEIVRRLDGLPLAIELAAARTPLLGLHGLARRLDRHLTLLRQADGGRHATLDATIRWSWDLLDEDLRRALARLGVFEGGFTLDAAEHLIDDPEALEQLEALLQHGLVERVGVLGDRMRLLESVRAFAMARLSELGEVQRLRERHAAWFTQDEIVCRRRGLLDPERFNLDAAYLFLRRGDYAAQAQALRALWGTLDTVPVHPLSPERAALVDAAIAGRLTVSPEWRARALAIRGLQRFCWGAVQEAEQDYREAVAALPTGSDSALALRLRGGVVACLMRQGRHAEALPEARRCVAGLAGVDAEDAFIARHRLVALLHLEGQLDEAREVALALLAGAVEPERRATALHALGFIDHDRGALERAADWYTQAIDADPRGTFHRLRALGNLAMVHHERAEHAEARARYAEACAGLSALGSPVDEGEFRAAWAALEATAGDRAAALSQLARAEVALSQQGGAVGRGLLAAYGALVARASGEEPDLSAVLDEPAVARAWELKVPLRLLGLSAEAAVDLRVERDGRWFQLPGAEAVDVSRRGAMRRMLALLAQRHAESPGEPVEREDLFEVGWPGDNIAPDSAAHRVRVGLSELRKLGLEDALRRESGGYLLAPELRVERVDGAPP